MTHRRDSSTLQLSANTEDHRIARYAAAAIALSVVEAAIPSPLPGIKPGLANIITLVVLARQGWREAAWVTLLRVLAGSLVLGQFLAPGFFLSLSGSLFSLATLAVAQYLPTRWFGPVSHSLLAAFAHFSGQLILARLWLIPHDGLWLLLPFFAFAATLFGLANGLAATKLLMASSSPEETQAPQ